MSRKFKFKMPHSYVIIFIMIVVAFIMGNVIDAGEFDRITDTDGNTVVVPGSYHKIPNIGISLFQMFMGIQQGFVDGARIIFFVVFAYAFVYMIIKNGSSIIYLGVAVGFASATINPFTIGIAQQVAGVKLFSGVEYRIVCFIVFITISILYVWRYAHKIKQDPTKSLLYGENKI